MAGSYRARYVETARAATDSNREKVVQVYSNFTCIFLRVLGLRNDGMAFINNLGHRFALISLLETAGNYISLSTLICWYPAQLLFMALLAFSTPLKTSHPEQCYPYFWNYEG